MKVELQIACVRVQGIKNHGPFHWNRILEWNIGIQIMHSLLWCTFCGALYITFFLFACRL